MGQKKFWRGRKIFTNQKLKGQKMSGIPCPSKILDKAAEFSGMRDILAKNFLGAAQQPTALADPCDRPLPHEAEVSLALANRAARASLKADKVALQMATGARAYGICEDCGEPIPEKRLQAIPHATKCVACQAEAEAAKSNIRYKRRLGASQSKYL